MATAQHPAANKTDRGVPPLRAAQGYSFIWRKLHSLMGIIPIGAFLLEHLLSNFEALHGPAAQGRVFLLLARREEGIEIEEQPCTAFSAVDVFIFCSIR